MLHHVEILVRDLERSVAFWTPFMQLLGDRDERWTGGMNYVQEGQAYLCCLPAPREHVDAIEAVLDGVDLDTYRRCRAIRSSVEREFILIGEAVASLRRIEPALAAHITDARVIVGFRNVLTHEYAGVDDEAVYGVATEDVGTLRRECADLLASVEATG